VALALLVVAATLAPVLAPHEPTAIRLSDKLLPPSAAHWLGTDYFGRDVLSRVLHGGRVSLAVGLLVVAIAMAVGVPLALVAGFVGGRVDNVLMRVMDAFLTFPRCCCCWRWRSWAASARTPGT
jgi:peptide/nickel transport system permease protein